MVDVICLTLLGLASTLAYLAALGLGDLRANTIEYEIAFFGAFALYLAAVRLVLQLETRSRATLWIVAVFAVAFRLISLPSRPTLSDDMYRYVWDGRVQAHGLSPYRYPPAAPEVAALRKADRTVWPHINRKPAITVYPPGAQLAFAGIWRVAGDSLTGFKTVFTLAELAGGILLIRLLRRLGLPPERGIIYLWSPLLVFEVAHAGHVDGLMLPLLIAAFHARISGRPWLLGFFLGAATLVKLLPVLLLPALLPPLVTGKSWGSRDWLRAGPLPVLIAFGAAVAGGYALYWQAGASPAGFLPSYFGENFNLGLARLLFDIAPRLGLTGASLANIVTFGGLAALALLFTLRPAASARQSLGRCVWLIGWFTLFTQNLFSWYLLWLLPLVAIFVEPGRLRGIRLTPAAAWLAFSGTVALSYLFFIHWRVVPWGQAAEYLPLYALLAAAAALRLRGLPLRRPSFGAVRPNAASTGSSSH